MRVQYRTLRALFAVMLLASTRSAAQTSIGFSSLSSLPCLPQSQGGIAFVPQPLTINGFAFTASNTHPAALSTWCPNGWGWAGRYALFGNYNYASVTMSRVGGGPFSITSADLASYYPAGPLQVTFVGSSTGHPDAIQTFSITGQFSPVNFSSTFTNLDALTFDCCVQNDNIAVSVPSVTPEPTTGALLGGGVFAFVALRRRRSLILLAGKRTLNPR